jgi:hypothetical protein
MELTIGNVREYTRPGVQAVTGVLRRMDEIFGQDKAFSPLPTGLLVEPLGIVGVGQSWSPRDFPYRRDVIPANYRLIFLHPTQRCQQGRCRIDSGEGPSLVVYVNMPHQGIDWSQMQGTTNRGPETIYFAPRQVGSIAGFPLYETGYVIMTRREQSLWVPVTQAEYIQHRMQELQQWHSPPRMVAAMQEELAALTPEERGSPAYCCHENPKRPSGLTTADDQRGHMAVRLNKDFFDPHLSASDVQLLIVGTALAYDREYRGRPGDPTHQFFTDVQDGLDWAALAALLR